MKDKIKMVMMKIMMNQDDSVDDGKDAEDGERVREDD